MLEARGRVVAIEAGLAWVESARQGGCSSCASKGACGSQMLGEALSPAPASNRVLAQDDLGVSVGDEVLFGIPEDGALRAALVMYGVPLLGLMLGVVLTQAWGDGWAGLTGFLGLGLGLLLVRLWPHSRSVAVRPLILERLPSATSGLTDMKTFPIKSL